MQRQRTASGIRLIWFMALTTILVSSLGVFASGDTHYDGKWWLALGKQQREGFVDGYLACYSYDVRGPIKFHYESGQMYAPRLEKYLLHHPEESEMSIEKLLWKMNASSDAPPVPKPHGTPAGPKTGKYGIYDGEFWREVDNPNRLGFVQGFLYCHSKHKTGPKNAFPRDPQWYVTAISKWYGIDEKDEGAINPKRANAKIPDVLFKFSETALPIQ